MTLKLLLCLIIGVIIRCVDKIFASGAASMRVLYYCFTQAKMCMDISDFGYWITAEILHRMICFIVSVQQDSGFDSNISYARLCTLFRSDSHD